MVTNSETRKLHFYAQNDDFSSSIDTITCLAFFQAAGIPVKQKKPIKELMDTTEGKKFFFVYPCVLERISTLRKNPTIVGGATNILRFIYQTEIIDYNWYPQNPLERSKLDQFFSWHAMVRDSNGFLDKLENLKVIEQYFLTTIHPFLCGFADMTICDVTAFFAILPIWRTVLDS